MSTPNMLLTLPTDHGSADVWDTILDAVFNTIDAHDHTAGKGVKVPSAGLNINADVSWASGGSSYAVSDLRALDFAPKAASTVAALADALFCNSDDSNNLYWRNHSGTNVRITNGASLDVTLVGGIGGDYTSVGALFSFDDATDSYWAQQQGGPRPWARLRVGDVDIYETASSIVNRVRLKSPAALAASYAVTWLTALPVGARAMQIDNTGAMTASNTFTANVTAPDLKNSSNQTIEIPGAMAIDVAGSHTKLANGTGWTVAASANRIVYPIPLKVGDRITGFTLYANKTSSGADTIHARIRHTQGGTGTEISDGTDITNNANNPGFITLSDNTLALDIAQSDQYYLVFIGGGATGNQVLHCVVTYTRP